MHRKVFDLNWISSRAINPPINLKFMKHYNHTQGLAFAFLFLALACPGAFADSLPIYPANLATAHVSEHAIVQGILSRVLSMPSGDIVLDVNGIFPNAPFVAIIHANNVAMFPKLSQHVGQNLGFRGIIRPGKHGEAKMYLQTFSQIIIPAS
jgi:hypothetical protein